MEISDKMIERALAGECSKIKIELVFKDGCKITLEDPNLYLSIINAVHNTQSNREGGK